MSEPKNAVVIGTGAAGSGAARTLSAAGWKVTAVERDRVGGTCLWYGCMPKKALYTSAKSMRALSDAEGFGIDPGQAEYDWQGVLAWKWHAQETYAGDQAAILAERGIELLSGDAKFISPEAVRVDETTIEADAFVVATGSTPFMPPVPGIDLADTSADALGYLKVPEHLVIVGAGFIGLEFAGIYASFGSRVTVIAADDRILPAADPDVAAVAARQLEHLGVTFVTGSHATALAGERGDISVEISENRTGATRALSANRVLMATGRRPAVSGLDLEAACVESDGYGHVVLDTFQRSTNPRVWFAGDAAGGMMQTPVASYEGRTIAESIDSGTPKHLDCSTVPTTVYTIPQIASVGLTEEMARSRGLAVRVSSQTFEYLGAAIIENERDGLVKLVFGEDDDRLLGAQIAGPSASDLIYGLAVALKTKATAADLKNTLGVHPAYCEAINWAAWG